MSKNKKRDEMKAMAQIALKYGGHHLSCTKREHNMFPCSCGWDSVEDRMGELVYGCPERTIGTKEAK